HDGACAGGARRRHDRHGRPGCVARRGAWSFGRRRPLSLSPAVSGGARPNRAVSPATDDEGRAACALPPGRVAAGWRTSRHRPPPGPPPTPPAGPPPPPPTAQDIASAP